MAAETSKIGSIGIIGAGLMGCGIAEVCALAGFRTVLVKATEGDPMTARARVDRSLKVAIDRGKVDASAAEAALGRLTVTSDKLEAARCDLVIEAIVEDLATKRALFADLAPHLAPHAILASNTSTLRRRQAGRRVVVLGGRRHGDDHAARRLRAGRVRCRARRRRAG